MIVERGALYLVDFGLRYQSEMGKVRPALVWQSDYINRNLDAALYPSVIVIPCTTRLRGGRFRLALSPRDALEKESELILNWICSVDLKRFVSGNILTRLTRDESSLLRQRLAFVMGDLD
jgi:mRNA interferase MazF